MCYDKSECCKKLRQFTSVHLAWWHNYKWASRKIFEVFGKDFIAGMFHTLFPSVNFNMKYMSHTTINTYLTYIRLAYPSFRQQLVSALRKDDLTEHARQVLMNLQSMCEFFIPVVTKLHTVSCFIHTSMCVYTYYMLVSQGVGEIILFLSFIGSRLWLCVKDEFWGTGS